VAAKESEVDTHQTALQGPDARLQRFSNPVAGALAED
jgi:hypothetical protein